MEEKDKNEDLLETGMDMMDEVQSEPVEAPQLSKEENLINELRKIREESDKDLQEARDSENTSRLLAQLAPSLAQYMAGTMQTQSGANIKMPQVRVPQVGSDKS